MLFFLMHTSIVIVSMRFPLLQLEIRLAEKEESLLEKDLILEQDCRLCDRTKGKADAGKDDTLILAKKVKLGSAE